ncbi:MAG: hypothetical protein PVJ21_06275 [Anaerolineales bacterium]|jgi:hypothetical protein
MTNSTQSDEPAKKKWYENQGLIIAVLGVVAALLTALPSIIAALPKPESTATAILPTATIVLPTLTSTVAPTLTATETSIPSTATLSPTPTETATATPVTPPLGCLDRWEVISSVPGNVFASGSCEKFSYPELGIEPIQSRLLSFAQPSILINETTGITTKFSNNVTEISFNIKLDDVSDGEFWIALSNGKNPDSNAVSIRLQSNGLVRIYDTSGNLYAEKTWNELRGGTIYSANKPFYYNFVIRISGTNLNIGINSTRLNLSGRPEYLFFGYKNKSATKDVSLFAEVSNLEMK